MVKYFLAKNYEQNKRLIYRYYSHKLVIIKWLLNMEEIEPIVTPDTITAGNLHFYNINTFLSWEELQSVLNSVIKNYNEIGIRFKHASICENDNFPALKGLDILLYALDGDNTLFCGGRYGINDDYCDHYTGLKKIIDIPYDKMTSEINTGFFTTKNYLICLDKIYPSHPFPREEILKIIIQIATHEIGHGLGASHVWDTDYFMGRIQPKKEKSFHPDTVNQMKQFIETVNSHNLNPGKIGELREIYLGKYIPP